MALDWSQGYVSSWRVERIDPRTWSPCGTLYGVESIEVERDGTDEAPLLETAAMTVTSAALDEFEPGWHRITMEAVQGMASEAVPVATVWLDADSGTYDKGYREDKLVGRSVLYQAAGDNAVLGDGAFAPKGADGARWCADALGAFIDAPVSTAGGFELERAYVFDLDDSVLQSCWALLKAYGWCMQVDGRGEVLIMPLPDKPALVLDRDGAATLQPAVAYKDGTRTYKREYAPNVHPFDIVRGMLPERGLDGDYRVLTQKLTCSRGIIVEEAVEWA